MKKTKVYRNRRRELIRAVFRSGILRFLREPNLRAETAEARERRLEERDREMGKTLVDLFVSLGATYVKLGQMLSTRHDILSEPTIRELEVLQDDVAPEPVAMVRRTIEEELRAPIESVFRELDEAPIASASIATAYRAKLVDGTPVCIKVQRRGIAETIRIDIQVLEDVVRRFAPLMKFSRVLEVDEVLAAFRDQITFELDFEIEAQNLETFTKFHRQDKYVRAPKCYHEWTTTRIMTLEYIGAMPLKEVSKQCDADERAEIARRILYSYSNQVFRDGFFHGDPHPGNIMIEPEQHIVFLDFGIIGRLSKKNKYAILTFFLGVAKDSPRIILDGLLQMGLVSARVDLLLLQRDMQNLLNKYLNMTLHEVKISELTNEFFALLYRYEIRVPGSLTMLAKTFIIMEGVVENLGLEQNILEIAEPIARKLVRNFVSRDYVSEYVLPVAYDSVVFLRELPEMLTDFSRKLRENGYRFDLRTEESALQRRANRQNAQAIALGLALLANAILFSAFFLVAAFSPRPFIAKMAQWGAILSAFFEVTGTVFFIVRWFYNARARRGEW